MSDQAKSREELFEELNSLRKRVSDLREVEEKLSRNEEKYRDIVENMQEGFHEVNLNGDFAFVNDSMCKILGYERNELLGMNYRRYADEENTRRVYRVYNEVFRTGAPVKNFEWQIIRKDGDLRDIEVSAALILDKAGNPTGFRGIVQDITERKKTVKELLESGGRYRLLAERMTDMVWIMDMNLHTIYVSPSIRKVLGYSPEERLRQDVHEQLTPASLSVAFDTLARELTRERERQADPERNLTLELEFYHQDGSTRWLESVVKGIRDDSGNLIQMQGMSRDVTKRRQLEEALRDSEERWKFALEGAGDGVWDWNAETDMVFFSRQWKAMLGYEEDEIGDTLEEWDRRLHPDDRAAVYDALESHFRRETAVYQNEHRLCCKDGTYKWILDRGMVVQRTPDGKPLRVIGTHTDLTKYKSLEAALRESERKYRELSIIDDLTGLFNVRYFNHQLQIEMDRSGRYDQPLTMLLLDLDNFKLFNDTYGHVAGDEVLARFGAVVKRCLRHADTAYRYGGEEFTVILPMTTGREGVATAERIRTEFKKEEFYPAAGEVVGMTVSIGIGQYRPGDDMKSFVHRADQLMYKAKRQGKDRFCSG